MSISSMNTPRQTISERYGSASALIWLSLMLGIFLIAMIGLAQVDPRLINGVSIWDKPGKFALSVSIHLLTLTWGLQLTTQEVRSNKSTRKGVGVLIFAVVSEMAWLTFKASRGEASHFNMATPFAAIMYTLMGVGAVSMTVVTIIFGWKIARAGNTPMHMATGYGFILAGILTALVAGYMSAGTSHSVGGDVSDATGLALFHWSTTGGDLRVPHFAALHITQALPFLGWLIPDRRIVIAALTGAALIVTALFIQALMGIPLLAV
jgi:hypothetical protein